MIREKSVFCKLITEKRKQTGSREGGGQRRSGKERCPTCGRRGSWRAHASYERNIIEYESGKVEYSKVRVERKRCESCGHTHAVLPDYIVPYSTYGLLFMLRVLGEYYLRARTVEVICRKYNITPSMMYQWKAAYERDKGIWLGVVEDLENSGQRFMQWLMEVDNYSEEFGGPFYKKAARSFLQRHRDAARNRRAV